MWRILSLNLHKIFLLLYAVILPLYQIFLVLQIKKLVHKKHMRTLCDLGLSALSENLFRFVFLQKRPGFLQ